MFQKNLINLFEKRKLFKLKYPEKMLSIDFNFSLYYVLIVGSVFSCLEIHWWYVYPFLIKAFVIYESHSQNYLSLSNFLKRAKLLCWCISRFFSPFQCVQQDSMVQHAKKYVKTVATQVNVTTLLEHVYLGVLLAMKGIYVKHVSINVHVIRHWCICIVLT